MTVFQPANFIEAYRVKAAAKDIHELTGRSGRPDLTEFVNAQILLKIDVMKSLNIVDVGCGNGILLQKIAAQQSADEIGRLIGILPTIEEVERVRGHLQNSTEVNSRAISIELGLADKTNLPDRFADTVILSGVLPLLENKKTVVATLDELNRILKSDGTLFIGSVPDRNEWADKNYGDSISAWLGWVLKNQGVQPFAKRLMQTIPAYLGKEPFVISPKVMFFMPPPNFIQLLERHGFSLQEHYRHQQIMPEGDIFESKTRWNYIAYKNALASAVYRHA